jgi:hypothetical protein
LLLRPDLLVVENIVGVPQGTVLDPILFFAYINDFNEYIKHSTLRLFVDDSILYKTIKDESDTHKLQEDLDAAAKWENDWLMQFHPDKCSVMHITTKKNPIHHKYVLVSGRSALDHFEFTDVRFGMRVPDTATVF